MKIAHFFHPLDPAQGGTFRVMVNMVLETAKAGVEVEVWTIRIPDPDCSDVRKLRDVVPIIDKAGPPGFLGKESVNRFTEDIARVDLVHLHSLWQPYNWRAINACARAGKPTMLTMHGMLMDHPMSIKTPKKKIYLSTIGRRMFGRVGAVQMLNSEESRQSRRTGADYPYFELPNGVDASEFASLPERGVYRRTEPELADKRIILSMGRLHEIKGPELLLGAFLDLAKDHDDIALVMAGPDEGMLPRLENMLSGHPAAGRVRLPGLVQGELRLALLADADIFAQCSRHETASMSIIEAAYAGRCLLLTDKCNCPEVAEADAGVIVPLSQAGVRSGLEELLADDGTTEARGARGRALVEDRFLLSAITPRLIEHYERLIAAERYPSLQG